MLDWGFTGAEVYMVEALQRQGFKIWWFCGAEAAARENFKVRHERGEHPAKPAEFEKQITFIKRARSDILRVFTQAHMLQTLDASGNYMTSKEIYDHIMASAQ